MLRRGGGREDLCACKSTSDLISDLLQNKIVACLSRKERFCVDKNVVHLVCKGDTIGVYDLVNVRKVVNCINIKPSWLSIKWKSIMFQIGLMLHTLLRQHMKEGCNIIN